MAIELEGFQLVLLRRPAAVPDFAGQEPDRIQREHLAFYDAMRADGRVVTNGPVRDQPDESLRGIAIFAAGSADHARELANADPAVQAGVLEAEAMSWLCPPRTMVRSGTPVTVGE